MSAQPDFDIVVGSMIFLRLVGADWAMSGSPQFDQVRRRLRAASGTSPLPHPATQREYANWVAGWGSGLVPVREANLNHNDESFSISAM